MYRVGIIAYGMDRPLTGIGRYTLELVRALAMRKERPEIVLLAAGGLGPLGRSNGFDVVRLQGARLLPGLMTVGNVSIRRAVRQARLDVVHDPTGVSPLLFAGGKLATVVTVHDVFAWSLPGHSSLLDTIIYRHWLPRRLPKVDAVITVSDQSRQDVIKYLAPPADKLKIIPYGVSKLFHPLPIEEARARVSRRFDLIAPYVLYVGALTKRKNIARIIEAFARLRDAFPDHLLVLAGPFTWKETPVEDIMRRLGLEDSVLLTGPLTDEDLPALYGGADLFAFPSLYEGFGLPVLEAMACGTPVITSNVSSLPYVAGDAAILVDPHNVEEIAAAMQQVLADKRLAAELRAKGLERAKAFSWERTASETIAVYDKVLNGQAV